MIITKVKDELIEDIIRDYIKNGHAMKSADVEDMFDNGSIYLTTLIPHKYIPDCRRIFIYVDCQEAERKKRGNGGKHLMSFDKNLILSKKEAIGINLPYEREQKLKQLLG